MERPEADRRTSLLVAVVLAAVAVVFLALAWPRITAPFGDSDEGINGAVWGYDARSLRELGPVESRLGGVRLDGSKYANHPPLIVVETAIVEAIVGEHPWSTRAAAWLGALASIPLLFLLLRALARSPVVAAAATAATLVCHFFVVYGSMLDTMIIALPFAIGSCLLWLRQWHDDEPRLVAVVAVAGITALAGWQGVFLVGLCGASLAVRHRRDPRRSVRAALPWLGAAVVGVALTVGWGLWVYGSVDVLRERLGRRTGGEDATLGGMIAFQLPWLGQLLGIGLLAVIGTLASLRDRRFRPLAALTLTAVFAYAVLLRQGAGGHQFWNYWALLPAAVGAAYVLDALARWAGPRFGRTGGTVVLPLALAGLVAVLNLAQPNQAAELIDDGIATYEVVDATPRPPGQETIPTLGEPHRADDWLRYRIGPPAESILDEAQLRRLAAEHPRHLVLVLGACADPDPTGICRRLTFGGRPAAGDDRVPARMVPAEELVRNLE